MYKEPRLVPPAGLEAAPEQPVVVSTSGRPVYDCISCGKLFPDTKFPYRGKDNRCVYCIAEANEQARKEMVYEQCKDAYSQLLKLAKHEITKVPTTERLLVSLIDQWGSLELFASEWFQDHQQARMKSPGSKHVLDSKTMIAKLILRHNESRPAEDVSQLTDEDLAKELTRVALEAISSEDMDEAKWALMKAFVEASQYQTSLLEVEYGHQGIRGGIQEEAEGSVESLPAPPTSTPILPDGLQ